MADNEDAVKAARQRLVDAWPDNLGMLLTELLPSAVTDLVRACGSARARTFLVAMVDYFELKTAPPPRRPD